MKKINTKVIKIILIIIWMAVVFLFSNQGGTKSSGTSTRVTELIVDIVEKVNNKEYNLEEIHRTEMVIRKLAHYTIYMVGGFLIMNYAYSTSQTRKKQICWSLFFGMFYAITDEIHQYFVPGRSARIFDVGIDTLGVITGVLIYMTLMKLINKIYVKSSKAK